MALFSDSTGHPGPATWRLGSYEDGEAEYPVQGISWFEAVAYAEFRGKHLPTLYHWSRAALPPGELTAPLTPFMVSLSNLGGTSPAPVASHAGLSAWGAYDMAGNVREWTWNSDGTGKRYIVGGSWSDPVYRFTDFLSQSPWARDAENGFRCVKYAEDEFLEVLERPLQWPLPDFHAVPKVPDEVFETVRSMYSYDRTPLNAVVEASTQGPRGRRKQRVTVDAAYGGERLILTLLLPDGVAPPYQAVVWFGGASILYLTEGPDAVTVREVLEFFVESGRVLVLPVYSGTNERNDGRTLMRWQTPNSRRELFVEWLQDLGRAIDYLEERDDIDTSKLAYAGSSMGAILGPHFFPYENRFRVGLLWSGGFPKLTSPVEVQRAVDSVRRTEIPILMITGRHDVGFPLETLQRPFFELLGTPREHKQHVLFEAGHWPFPRAQFIRENLAWLDRYLGPVEKSGDQG
jgi:pimeloyl-ACP methyl ester carboxylesterase